MKKIYLTLLSCFIAIVTMAQTPGFSYQAVILNPNTQILPGNNVEQGLLSESDVMLRFTIENELGTEYKETHITKTDAYGMVSLMVGQGIATIGSFTDVAWVGAVKYLKVEIDFTASGANYESLDRQALTYLPQPMSNESIAIIEGIQTNIASNALTIADETTRATAAEGVNSTGISTNATGISTNTTGISTNTTGISTNATDISDETNRATTAEAVNATAIADETTRATTAEAVNAAAISAEETRATAAEGVNATGISTNTSGLSTNATGISTNATDISDETNRATTAEAVNATAIADETTRATTAEQTNADAISVEETRATYAEQANADAISAEANTARAAEQANADAISAEYTRASAAEVANASAITAEAITARAAEAANANAIVAEANAARDAEQVNATAIANETVRATAAEDGILVDIFTVLVTKYNAADFASDFNSQANISIQPAIDANTLAIATNTSDIATNASGIFSNTTGIATNAANFSNIDYAQIFATQLTGQGLPVNTIMTGPLLASGNDIITPNIINATGNLTGDVTGNLDGIIGANTPESITGTVITANTNFAGDLTGNVTGNVTGDVTGNLFGESLSTDRISTLLPPANTFSIGTMGEIRFDSNFIYICVATNSWKRFPLSTW